MNWLSTFLKRKREPSEKGEIPIESITNFTPRAKEALSFAKSEAERFNQHFIDSGHLLLGVMKLGRGIAFNVLNRMGVEATTVIKEIERGIGSAAESETQSQSGFTAGAKKALLIAQQEARELHHMYIGTEHILLGLMHEREGAAAQVLKSLNINVKAIRTEILKELDPKSLSGGIE